MDTSCKSKGNSLTAPVDRDRYRWCWRAIRPFAWALILIVAACGGSGSSPTPENVHPDSATGVAAPVDDGDTIADEELRWGHPQLLAVDVPAVYLEEWSWADNQQQCALIAPASLGAGADAAPRAAAFAGGWAVAYDLPGQRSAFGVAGTGSTTSGEIFAGWTNRRDWADGSFAEYGPEGGEGPNQLAYLRVAGQDCLYNVWSRLGVEHLELLLDQLRRVQVGEG